MESFIRPVLSGAVWRGRGGGRGEGSRGAGWQLPRPARTPRTRSATSARVRAKQRLIPFLPGMKSDNKLGIPHCHRRVKQG